MKMIKKKKGKRMNESEREKLFDICRRSKRGLVVSDDERDWSLSMFKRDQEQYSIIHKKACKQAVEEYTGPLNILG